MNTDLGNDEWHKLLQQKIGHRSVDVIVGGPPCQGYSLTGTRKLNDPRNTLYDSLFRAMDFFKPKVVLIENVKGMSSLFRGKAKKDVLVKFHKRNYKTDVQLLNAASLGTPQIRQRLFILASKGNGSKITLPSPIFDENSYLDCETALSDLPSLEDKNKFSKAILNHTMLHEQLVYLYRGFRRDAHPMAIMVGGVGALSAFYHDSTDFSDLNQRMIACHRLIAKIPTIGAMAYKYSIGQPFV